MIGLIIGKNDQVSSLTYDLLLKIFGLDIRNIIVLISTDSITFISSKNLQDKLKRSLRHLDLNPFLTDFHILSEDINLKHLSKKQLFLFPDNQSSEHSRHLFQLMDKCNFVREPMPHLVYEYLITKSTDEVDKTKMAATLLCYLFSELRHLITSDESSLIGDDLKAKCEDMLLQEKENLDEIDFPESPKMESNSNMKELAESPDGTFVIISLSLAYKMQPASITRTLFMNPSESQSENYKFLLDLQHWAMSKIAVGLKLSTFFKLVKDQVKSGRPLLEKSLKPSLGFILTMSFSNRSYEICQATSKHCFINNCMVYLSLGFTHPDFTASLSDTIFIDHEAVPTIITEAANKSPSFVQFINCEDSFSSDHSPVESPQSLHKGISSFFCSRILL
ncbi:splicing associated factor Dre4 [Cichlidogyrus casuarinus]|uniref:FACT complex subunit n=1 Tax=Cichlidogyrus casuarinus TaxID=1844966 RepID=A0ABD2QAX1_9PLAT